MVRLGLALGALLTAFPGVALADASIAVRLVDAEGRPVDGSVTLTKQGVTRSCRTTASRCTITAPAGTYAVTMRPARGAAPPTRTVSVPASGSISLALRAGPATTVTGTTTSQATAQPAVARPAVQTGSASPVTTRRATRARRVTATPTPTTAPSTGTTSGTSAGATSGGSGSTTTTPATVTAVSTAQQTTTATSTGRNLTTGRVLAVSGTVLDGAGRPVDATLTVRRSGTIVGTARTTAGRFSLYDLPAASYDVALESSRGTRGTGRFTVGTSTIRVTLRVP